MASDIEILKEALEFETKRAPQCWEAASVRPASPKAILILLDQVVKEKHIPKQRRYAKGSRRQEVTNDGSK